MKAPLLISVMIIITGALCAQDLSPISLPEPMKEGGKPLMQCLNERHTTREFSTEALPPQTLSNLLWAAYGINREDGRRTAPSAMNNQETDVYVFLAEGVYLYDAKANALSPILVGDHRASAGKQEFVKDAPVNLVYAADFSKMGEMTEADKQLYSAADVGFIAENIYLFCASEGLNSVVRGWVDREEIAKLLTLPAEKKVILAQTIGYPAE